jgi:integrase
MKGHVRRRSARSFEIKYDIGKDNDGKRRTVTKSFKGTRKEAQAELARLLARVADGGHIEPSKLTVADYLRSRVAHWRAIGTISPKTAQGYDALVRFQIAPHIGGKLLQKLSTADVEHWHAKLLAEGRADGRGGVSARMVGHAHRLLAKALREAVRHEMILRNVAVAQRPPKVATAEMVILSPVQVAGLPAMLDGHEMAAPAITALFTGTRRGELLALRWNNVDLAAKVMRIRASLEETKAGLRFKGPKSKAGVRDVTLPAIVVETLHAHRKRQLERRLLLGQGKPGDDDLVFPAWDGSPWGPDRFSAAWGKLARSHGIDVSFHALRHTHASQLIDAGVDVVTIARRLGHSSPTITLSTYAHLFKKDDSKAAAAINAALGE